MAAWSGAGSVFAGTRPTVMLMYCTSIWSGNIPIQDGYLFYMFDFLVLQM